MDKKDMLRQYIINSEVRVFNNRIKVRVSNELATKYDNGCYSDSLMNMEKYFKMIDSLHIQYPSNAHPIFYMYIVPDDNYTELLKIPPYLDNGWGGGKVVCCYDLEGFNAAYGVSQNVLENTPVKTNISRIVNDLHELAHIIHSQFFQSQKIICEGFAEALPLYILDFEEVFDEHRDLILNLKEDQILCAEEVLNSERDHSYGVEAILPNRSCSFRKSYISSYLFVRGCMERIVEKYNVSKIQSVQYFLEIVRQAASSGEYLICNIADVLDLARDELLYGKTMQLGVVRSIENKSLKNNRIRV